MLPPPLGLVQAERVRVVDGAVRVVARTDDGRAVCCPDCGVPAVRRHSRYVRRLADAPVGGRPVGIALSARRLFRDNPACVRQTLAEQVAGLTARQGRRTLVLQRLRETVARALAGRAGARLAAAPGRTVSRVTLLHLLMAPPDPPRTVPRALGVDEFALRRGRVHGSIVIDVESHRGIDLLPDHQAATFAAWLTEHPGAAVVCRDRSGAFAEAARVGAPHAVRVADRWHLWRNLGEAVERAVAAPRACLREPEPDEPPARRHRRPSPRLVARTGSPTGSKNATPRCTPCPRPATGSAPSPAGCT